MGIIGTSENRKDPKSGLKYEQERYMSKKFKKTVALICAVCLVCVAMCGTVFAEDQTQSETEADYTDMQIYVDGLLVCRGYLKDGTTYVTMESMFNALGLDADIQWSETSEETPIALPKP